MHPSAKIHYKRIVCAATLTRRAVGLASSGYRNLASEQRDLEASARPISIVFYIGVTERIERVSKPPLVATESPGARRSELSSRSSRLLLFAWSARSESKIPGKRNLWSPGSFEKK